MSRADGMREIEDVFNTHSIHYGPAYDRGQEAGVKAAREAVAALMPDTADEGVVLQALAAIDALIDEGRETG